VILFLTMSSLFTLIFTSPGSLAIINEWQPGTSIAP
jgi:hypothetical protein